MSEIFIGRQPIYDRTLVVRAYELLYRANTVNIAEVIDDDHATSAVIINSLTEFGLDKLVGNNLAFINLPKSFIIGEHPIPLSKDQAVLEVLENIEIDDHVIAGIKRLSEEGYTIALDDFTYHDDMRPLIELADIIKVDIMGMDQAKIRYNYEKLKPYGVKLLAEKIETQEIFRFVKDLGFDYFQGHFFSRPNVIKRRAIPANRMMVLNLLSKLRDPRQELKNIATLVSNDVAISYKVMRYINSAALALPNKIESIQKAVIYLGLNNIISLASLVAMTNINDKPEALIATAMTRAKMCERLGVLCGGAPDTFFTVGLFSLLDALMDMRMTEVMETLPLAQETKAAILEHKGREGLALKCAINYERGLWDEIDFETLDPAAISQAYLDAIAWTDESIQQLTSTATTSKTKP